MRVIAQELQELKSVVAAVLDPSGLLLEANAGFMHLLGTSPARRIGANVALLFTKPAFTELASAKATEGGEIFRGTLGLIGADGQALDLPGYAWRSAFGICVIAEYDLDALQAAGRKHASAGFAQRELRYVEASLTDQVTGTGNRERLDEAIATEISRVRRTGLALSALITRIERLGQIGDRHGQEGTDKVLARFGYLLRLLTRPTDIAARYDAEQFVVLMPHTTLAQAGVVARRIHQALVTRPMEPLGETVAAGFGMAQFTQGEDAASFVRRLQGALANGNQSQSPAAGEERGTATA